jgi:hypothetical protein
LLLQLRQFTAKECRDLAGSDILHEPPKINYVLYFWNSFHQLGIGGLLCVLEHQPPGAALFRREGPARLAYRCGEGFKR